MCVVSIREGKLVMPIPNLLWLALLQTKSLDVLARILHAAHELAVSLDANAQRDCRLSFCCRNCRASKDLQHAGGGEIFLVSNLAQTLSFCAKLDNTRGCSWIFLWTPQAHAFC